MAEIRKPYVIVYIDRNGRLYQHFNLSERSIEDFISTQDDFEELNYQILFKTFGISEKQKNIILSKEFQELYMEPFSEVQEKVNSLIAKLRETGDK